MRQEGPGGPRVLKRQMGTRALIAGIGGGTGGTRPVRPGIPGSQGREMGLEPSLPANSPGPSPIPTTL